MTIKNDRAVHIVKALKNMGFEAYWVGGSVRDTFLKREPKDYDVVTNARPEEIERIFPKHHKIGKEFGVILVVFPEGEFEIATYREESDYADKRRPNRVTWSTARQDVERRDFTINALLYDPLEKKVIDYVGGTRDLKLRIIRFIGSPVERVKEDPVRILRAIRLKNQLDFQYEPATYEALVRYRNDLKSVAAERIGKELNSMLSGSNRLNSIKDLDKTGILQLIIPELEALKGTPQPYKYHQEGDVYDHSLKALASLPADAPAFLAWATLLHDIGKPQTIAYENTLGRPQITTYTHAQKSAEITKEILYRLRMSRIEIDTISWMIEHHMSLKDIEKMRPSRREAYVLDPRFPWLLELNHADATGAIPADLKLYYHNLKLYQKMKHEHERLKTTSPEILIDGHELQEELSLNPGPKIGELLEDIRDAQLQKKLGTKQEAIEYAKKLLEKGERGIEI